MARYTTFLTLALLGASTVCPAQQQDPTPRRDIDPWDRAKVQQAQAKRWIGFGTRQVADDTTVLGNGVGSSARTCITNVGTTTNQPATVGGFTPRYGPAPRGQTQDRVVVVNGSVINVCK
ncbi:hypothetical protein [Cognatilysobacter segetis]|uniref:hypothetical protein n=1 Tax=Cognatilysobacter segetis TaxID=2492394 RepID=UPI00106052E0|nr:hypothetical protein [Lysobacter segetis]